MNTGFMKNIIIAGFTGGGIVFVRMYIVIYARSKVFTVIKVAMMCHRSIILGGWYCHKRFCIPFDCGNNMSVYQMKELGVKKI